MASEQLRFIASYDDVIRFCGADEDLACRFREIFADAKSRDIVFDPILAAASNPSVLSLKLDLWTKPKNGSPGKRAVGTFDQTKFTRFFIATMKGHFENPDKIDALNRFDFDAYAYLMAYEEDIVALYGTMSLSKLQMAALHFIELGNSPKELDYVKYIASFDDLVVGTMSSNPGKDWTEWIPEVGRMHYENAGRAEIHFGSRQVTEFFDATKYIATYAGTAAEFTNEDGSINDTLAAIAFITIGSQNGLVRNGFDHNIFLANYPELLEDDVYINNEISSVKVAKLWLDRFNDGIDLSRFDPSDFKDAMGLADTADAFKAFVDTKASEYRTMTKRQKKLTYRFARAFCTTPSLHNKP